MSGEGEAARAWAEERLEELIRLAGPKFVARLDQRIESCADADHVAALKSPRTDPHGNRDRAWYTDRPRDGKAIGGGAIEGACKKTGTRPKLNSAR